MRLHTRVALGLLATGLTLLGSADAPTKAPSSSQSSEAPVRLRDANEREFQICAENSLRGDGPASNDCWHVPAGLIYEDDPWGRW